jgi:hypothetical protein
MPEIVKLLTVCCHYLVAVQVPIRLRHNFDIDWVPIGPFQPVANSRSCNLNGRIPGKLGPKRYILPIAISLAIGNTRNRNAVGNALPWCMWLLSVVNYQQTSFEFGL